VKSGEKSERLSKKDNMQERHIKELGNESDAGKWQRCQVSGLQFLATYETKNEQSNTTCIL
jgi:hypothetical protein